MKSFPLPKGFTTNIVAEDRIATCLFGPFSTGKTRFACSGPEAVGVVPLNRKCRRTVENIIKEKGRMIVMPDKDLIRVTSPQAINQMTTEQTIAVFRRHVNAAKEAAYKLFEIPQIKTIVIDDLTTFYDDVKYAIYGRTQEIKNFDKGPLNTEMRQFILSLTGKNLIVIAQSKEKWEDGAPVGLMPDGWAGLEYHMNAVVQLVFDADKKPGANGRYAMIVRQCQDKPRLVDGRQLKVEGEVVPDEMVNFQTLAMAIYPDSDYESWA